MIIPRRTRSLVIVEPDDNSSVSSTIEVDRKPLHETTDSADRKKHVQFDTSANVEYDNTVICREDVPKLWYKQKEYKLFRQATMAASKALAQTEAKNKAPFSFQRVVERTYALCLQVMDEHTEDYQTLSSAEERRHLRRWAQVAPHRIGLERWALRTIVRDKASRRTELVDTVLEMQDIKPKRNVNGRSEDIRKACQRISRASRMFAVAMAQAQAEALSDEDRVLLRQQ